MKREASSYFPNPVQLNIFQGVDNQAISKLEEMGIKNSKQLFDKAVMIEDRMALSSESGVSEADLSELIDRKSYNRIIEAKPEKSHY